MPAHRTLALAVLMAVWWITEAIPIPATSLLPLVAFPFLGIMTYREVAPHYGNNIIFLFMGGFFLAMAMQKWDLHKRLALQVIYVIGATPRRLVLGFMVATAFISTMISNTSTTLLMFPIALAVVLQLSRNYLPGQAPLNDETRANFRTALMLGIAYGASVGGVGTLIGTPPNVIFAGMVKTLYPRAPDVAFFQWMQIGMPLVLIFLPIIWLVLTRWVFPVAKTEWAGGRQFIRKQLDELGGMTRGERGTLVVFLLTAVALVFRRNIDLGLVVVPGWADALGVAGHVGDTTVIMSAAICMFVLPVDWRRGQFLLDWKTAVEIPWGILLLFGGGIALAKGFQTTGLAAWFGTKLTYFSRLPVLAVILMVCLMLTFLTELTSNTAMTTLFMPILASTAAAAHTHPFLLMIPATLSASCAFMLPVATAPNAIVFGSGYVAISDMARAGFVINLIGAVLITLVVYALAIPVFGIDPHVVPAWAK